jgi:hypothetical protein
MKAKNLLISLVPLVFCLMPASAVIVSVGHSDLPGCDVLLVPNIVDELGDPASFHFDQYHFVLIFLDRRSRDALMDCFHLMNCNQATLLD